GAEVGGGASGVWDWSVIRDARRAASDAERGQDKGDVTATPEWRPVRDRAIKALAEKSKDLEITAYLIEALVRMEGFAGLRDGFRLASDLMEKFWDGIYPPAVDGDVEDRFSHMLWLSGIDKPGTLIVPVRKIPLSDSASLGRLSFAHYLQAQALEQLSDSKMKQKRIEEGAITPEMVRSAIAETPPKFYGDLLDDLNQSAEQFSRFCTVLSGKSSYDPSSTDLKDVTEAFRDAVMLLAKDRIPAQAAAAQPAAAAAAAAGPAAVAEKAVDPTIIK